MSRKKYTHSEETKKKIRGNLSVIKKMLLKCGLEKNVGRL